MAKISSNTSRSCPLFTFPSLPCPFLVSAPAPYVTVSLQPAVTEAQPSSPGLYGDCGYQLIHPQESVHKTLYTLHNTVHHCRLYTARYTLYTLDSALNLTLCITLY